MVNEFVKAFFFIFAAEMGDKTQVLAMTFATQYKTSKVLLGVFIGSFFNHGLAIALGSYLSNFFPISRMQIVAGLAFIGFGLWALRYEEDEDTEENNKYRLGPILTVSLAFFVGELGDKTQLTAMTLATEGNFPIFILFGTVVGMIATSGVGIFIGKKVGERIPEIAIKLISSAVFIFFGILKLTQSTPDEYINVTNVSIFTVGLGIFLVILVRPLVAHYINKQKTSLREVAATLYTQAHEIKEVVENICLGDASCGKCEGNQCLIGFAKNALEIEQKKDADVASLDWDELPKTNNLKSFDQDQIAQAISMIIDYIINNEDEVKVDSPINKARQALEMIVFKEVIPHIKSVDSYLSKAEKKDKVIMEKIKENLKKIDKEKGE